uniref:ATP synthase F0 subunit 8 n=1 Tax=Paratoxodera polyacantha TaxID=2136287 RepID=A0A343VYT7_9NEOP|nr:ATP synthase F0 subunit 8 [Paratoxodera polyacantha]AVQ55073.1 ATP synthase F0 subunit 8 [Paratoxodera polyacantha]
MPQMMPLNWLMLFLLFTMLFLLVNMFTYYIIQIKSAFKSSQKTIFKTLNWKW